jgi:hypothetical protein
VSVSGRREVHRRQEARRTARFTGCS